jgi:hypothetical protein
MRLQELQLSLANNLLNLLDLYRDNQSIMAPERPAKVSQTIMSTDTAQNSLAKHSLTEIFLTGITPTTHGSDDVL